MSAFLRSLTIVVVVVAGCIVITSERTVSAGSETCNDIYWKGRYWKKSIFPQPGYSGTGDVSVDGNGNLKFEILSGEPVINLITCDAVAPGYGYYTVVDNMDSATSTNALVAPLWLAKDPYDVPGETDIEFYVTGGTPMIRYIVQPYTGGVIDNVYDAPFYSGTNPFSKPQVNVIEWYGGASMGSASNRMRFVTDVFEGTERVRAHDFEYSGSLAPGQAGDDIHAWITLHGTYTGGASDTMVITDFGSYALSTYADHAMSGAAAYTEESASYPAWSAAKAIDLNSATSWSSQTYTSADLNIYYPEYLAIWHGTAKATNYIRIRPRVFEGNVVHVPEHINIYYSANGVWNYQTTVSLPPFISPTGHTIDLAATTNDGYLLTTTRLRVLPGSSDDFRFQITEVTSGYRY